MIYETCCINSTAKFIDDMTDKARDITYHTFRKYAEGLDDWAEDMGYFRHPNQGLTLKNDFHVSYHRSIYRGKRCVYMCHSAIEYIWTEK